MSTYPINGTEYEGRILVINGRPHLIGPCADMIGANLTDANLTGAEFEVLDAMGIPVLLVETLSKPEAFTLEPVAEALCARCGEDGLTPEEELAGVCDPCVNEALLAMVAWPGRDD